MNFPTVSPTLGAHKLASCALWLTFGLELRGSPPGTALVLHLLGRLPIVEYPVIIFLELQLVESPNANMILNKTWYRHELELHKIPLLLLGRV